MTIRHLRIFITVAECKKMNLAAKKLYITQPTVSQAIRELEEHYGVKLFERLSKKLFITDAGKYLLFKAKNLVEQYDALEISMKENYQNESLRIGASLTVGAILLSDIINDLEEVNPNLDTFAFVNNTSIIEQKLLDSSLDVAIVEGKVKSNDLISIPMIDDYLVLVCGIDHPLANKTHICLNDLENQKFVVREKGSGTRELLDDFLKFHNLNVKIVWEASSPDTIRHAVINNHCLALMPMRVMQKDILEHRMNVIYNTTDEWNRHFSLVYHKDKNITDSILLLKYILKKYKSIDIKMDDLSSKLILG